MHREVPVGMPPPTSHDCWWVDVSNGAHSPPHCTTTLHHKTNAAPPRSHIPAVTNYSTEFATGTLAQQYAVPLPFAATCLP